MSERAAALGHRLTDRLRQYALLMRVDRPIGSLLLLWPTLWALWLASAGRPDPWVLLVFILGTFLMRSAGCVINDFADRDIDPHVARTRTRPIAAGRVAPNEALALFALLAVSAFILVLTLSALTVALALAAVCLAALYPFMKRITHLPQFVLGVAFSWGIPMAFAAETGRIPALAWLLVATNLCWVVAYDTMYAMVDRDDDLRIGAKSTAILFGRHDRVVIGLFQAATLLGLVLVGRASELNAYYYGGVAVAAVLAVYQQTLVYGRERDACFKAFVNNAWFGAAIFVGCLLAHL